MQCLSRRQFMEDLELCLRTLPAQQARAVMLRYCMGEETAHICTELGVTANNLNVMLHRARGALQASLHRHGSVGLC